ncbi:MAG: ATP phosphoribosyltransferase regulatory subunit [Gammaproteobacteria bacterium]
MHKRNRWLLPEGIDEVLPPHAAQLDKLCRTLVDLFTGWGYELVIPPLIEYLDSLLTGSGEDLDLQTFKITDQLTGRMMGIRADTTPQVARIDVHNLKRNTPARLCYLGPVVHTRPIGQGGTRIPLQIGAELFGHKGVESDAEILSLMLKAMQLSGLRNVHVDLGHVGIYRGLSNKLKITADQELLLFDALQRKAAFELEKIIDDWAIPSEVAELLLGLTELNGDIGILDDARRLLASAGDDVLRGIEDLQNIADLTLRQLKHAPLYFDLAELRGYRYHTGMMFTAYIPGQGQGVAFGGRYDDIGRAFGRSRPATGFSTDIKKLLDLNASMQEKRKAIFAPASDVPGLHKAVEDLRQQGEIVIYELAGQEECAKQMACDRELVLVQGIWKVKKV